VEICGSPHPKHTSVRGVEVGADDGAKVKAVEGALDGTDAEGALDGTDAEGALDGTDAEGALDGTDAEGALEGTDADGALEGTDADGALEGTDADGALEGVEDSSTQRPEEDIGKMAWSKFDVNAAKHAPEEQKSSTLLERYASRPML